MATNDPTPFQSIPWITTLLKDPTYKTLTIPSRTTKSSTEDSLFSKTINTPTTISACLSQYRPPPPASAPDQTQAEELRLFFLLGSDLNGYPSILHGGIVAALLDEATGLLLSLNGHVTMRRRARPRMHSPVR